MELKLDLHIHSALSGDGRMTLPEIVACAKARGLSGVAVCDHNAFLPPEQQEDGFLLIGGTELNTSCGHLLGLFLTAPVETHDFAKAVAAIHAQGGLAVLAHPFEHHGEVSRIAPILPLLDGLEVQNARAARKRRSANEEAAALAAELGLPRFAGSDAHVPREIGNAYVTVDAASLRPEDVKSALLRPGNPVFGQRSRSTDVARSQRTWLNKSHAGLRKRVRWTLFAAKCLAEDLKEKITCR